VTAPRWIAEAIEAATEHHRGEVFADLRLIRDEKLAAALIERLPVEAMAASVLISCWDVDQLTRACPHTWEAADAAFPPPARVQADIAARIARVLADGDPEIVTLTDLYQSACRALDAAGVPYAAAYADDGDQQIMPLNLVGRIRWLAQQRPTRLELQRLQSDRDAQIELRATAERERNAARESLQLFIERVASAAQTQICNNADHAVARVTEIVRELIGIAGVLDRALVPRSTTSGELLTIGQRVGRLADMATSRGEALDLANERIRTAAAEFENIDAALDAAGIERAFDRLQERLATRLQRIEHAIAVSAGRQTALDAAHERIEELEGETEVLSVARDAATSEAEHNERELVDLRRRFDDLQRDRDRLASDLNQLQGDLDTSERKLREAERELQRARY
jgi:hypothetical protein